MSLREALGYYDKAAEQIDNPDGSLVLVADAARTLLKAIALVDEQAEDEGLWFIARTAPEAYLQQELRRLHAVIEHGLVEVDE